MKKYLWKYIMEILKVILHWDEILVLLYFFQEKYLRFLCNAWHSNDVNFKY